MNDKIDLDRCDKIYEQVIEERERQAAQWGGVTHDDKHDPFDWEGFIVNHAKRLTLQTPPHRVGRPTTDYRERLIKIAALAFAAVESFDRLDD